MNDVKKPFEKIPIKQKHYVAQSRYRVYCEDGKCVTVEAENALGALQASGQTKAKRIERDTLYAANLYADGALSDPAPPPPRKPPVEEPATPAPAAAENPPEPVETPAPAQASAPAPEPVKEPEPDPKKELSKEEVDKLLSGG